MSDWVPNWPELHKSLEDACASASASAPPPSDDETLKRLNADIKEYLVELGLSDLARLFMEEANKRQGIQSIPFVRTWIQLESEIKPLSAPPDDKEMEVMIPLNEGIEKYLDYLDIETRSFKEKAWTRAEGGIRLIKTWVERVYPQFLMLQELRKIQTGSNMSPFDDRFIHFVCM